MRRKSKLALVRAKIRRLFIYKTDLWHFCLGLLAGLIFPFSRWITITIACIYLLYQHLEHEHVYESIKDMVTFLSGLVLALLIVL
ncbi:MAG: hypothetical protein QW424_05385 [Candidatus Bathyarchaeia archaeon]